MLLIVVDSWSQVCDVRSRRARVSCVSDESGSPDRDAFCSFWCASSHGRTGARERGSA